MTSTTTVDREAVADGGSGTIEPRRLVLEHPLRSPLADLEPAIEFFHRCLQRGWLEGALLDVADYRHVPAGPGVMVVGHDLDVSLRPDALVMTRKRSTDDVATQLQDLLRAAAVLAEAAAYDGTLDLDVDLGAATITLLDRAEAARVVAATGAADRAADALAEAVEPAFAAAWGSAGAVDGLVVEDPRAPLRATADARRPGHEPVVATAVVDRLGGSRAPMQSPYDVPVEVLAARRDEDGVVVLDVREESERAIVDIGGVPVPLAELEDRIGELDPTAPTLVHCRAGLRGARAVGILREHGFTDSWNVNGGLVAWADRIEPSTRRY